MNPKRRTKWGQGGFRQPQPVTLTVQYGLACTPPSYKSRGGQPNENGPLHRLSCFERLIGLKLSLSSSRYELVFGNDGEGTIKAV